MQILTIFVEIHKISFSLRFGFAYLSKISVSFSPIPIKCVCTGNNIENHIMGMSDSLAQEFDVDSLKQILTGNPQGQEDDGNNTPIIIVREK